MKVRGAGTQRAAVIGAGISGLAAARALLEQGFAVQVLERARGVGGRTAQRSADEHRFDHGAQYFTSRDARFARQVDAWRDAGVVAPWTGRIVALAMDGTVAPVTSLERYVGVPGMNAMARHLARGLDVHLDDAVAGVVRHPDAWSLDTSSGRELGPFDALVLAMPPEQAARLAVPAGLLDAVRDVTLLPCWCGMVAFDERLPVDYDGAFVDSEVLDWVARDSSKPGRPGGERWVIHASPQWSVARLDEASDAVARTILDGFFGALGIAPREPAYLAGHRWSYARPSGEIGSDCLWHAGQAVALCGDWCRGGRVEGAYLSGLAAAGRVVGALR